jgi:hypothetical protein
VRPSRFDPESGEAWFRFAPQSCASQPVAPPGRAMLCDASPAIPRKTPPRWATVVRFGRRGSGFVLLADAKRCPASVGFAGRRLALLCLSFQGSSAVRNSRPFDSGAAEAIRCWAMLVSGGAMQCVERHSTPRISGRWAIRRFDSCGPEDGVAWRCYALPGDAWQCWAWRSVAGHSKEIHRLAHPGSTPGRWKLRGGAVSGTELRRGARRCSLTQCHAVLCSAMQCFASRIKARFF